MKLLLAFLSALPELIKLVEKLQSKNEEEKKEKKVKEDLVKINLAFENKDAKALNDIFIA